jgi:hypothetical protein
MKLGHFGGRCIAVRILQATSSDLMKATKRSGPLRFEQRSSEISGTFPGHLPRASTEVSGTFPARSEVVPTPAVPTPLALDKPKNTSRYISWSELLRRTFGIEIVCQKCKAPLRLIALIKSEDVAKKILTAMHLPVDIPQLRPARPPPSPKKAGGDDGWLN